MCSTTIQTNLWKRKILLLPDYIHSKLLSYYNNVCYNLAWAGSVAKRHGADGTATAAGAAVYDFDANGHRRAKNLIGIN